jgi:hypothetical protein
MSVLRKLLFGSSNVKIKIHKIILPAILYGYEA